MPEISKKLHIEHMELIYFFKSVKTSFNIKKKKFCYFFCFSYYLLYISYTLQEQISLVSLNRREHFKPIISNVIHPSIFFFKFKTANN